MRDSIMHDTIMRLEYKNDNVHDTKEFTNKKTKNMMETSQDKKNDLKNKNKIHKVKYKDKYKDKYIEESIKLQNTDSKEKSKNKNVHKIKHKNKDIKKKIKVSQNEDNDLTKELENKKVHRIKCKDKDIWNKIKMLQGKDSDSMEESEIKNIYKVKSKNKDINNITLQNEDTKLKKELQNEDTYKCKNEESSDEGVENDCSEITYLARQMKSAERLHLAEKFKLYYLHIQLRHTVPPQHKIETRAGSHMPTRKEIEEFEKILPMKKGLYSFEEDNIIANNWKIFCKLHNWDVRNTKPFLKMRMGNLEYTLRKVTERRKFVQFLADGLPNRTLYSVYHRFKNLYENNLQRRYKPEEDEMIIDHLENNPFLDEKRKYADLAKVLRRTRHSIWRRYRILKNKRRKND